MRLVTSMQEETEDSADCNAAFERNKMVTRIVTALVAIPIGILIIALNNEVLYYVAMTTFSVIAVYEMLVTTKYLKNKFSSAVSLIFAAITPIISG